MGVIWFDPRYRAPRSTQVRAYISAPANKDSCNYHAMASGEFTGEEPR